MKKLLIHIKQRLYIYVAADFTIALTVGYFWNLSKVNIKPISIIAIFIMLYPMLTGLEIEKIKKAGRNLKLIISTIIFAFFIASITAFIISRTILIKYPEIALAMVMVGAIPCSNMLIGWTGIAATMFSNLTVFALSFKPMLQVSYIMFLIYALGPWIRKFLGSEK